MERDAYERRLFQAAAAWNALAAAGAALLGADAQTRSRLGLAGAGLVSLHLCALCVALFGLGYYWVSRDPAANPALIVLGAVGKPLVFAVCVANALAGHVPLAWTLPALGDLAFGVLFLDVLRRRR